MGPSVVGGPLYGHQVKIERARTLLEEFQREADGYIEACERAVVHEPSTDRLSHRYVVRGIEPRPQLAALAGDVAHNARTALDQLAWEVATMHGVATDRLTFPVFRERPDDIDKLMPGAPGTVLEALDREQPYRDGDHVSPLVVIHELNRIDKHRILLPVTPAVYQVSWGVVPDNPPKTRYMHTDELSDGALIGEFTFEQPVDDPHIVFEVQLRLDPAVDEQTRVPSAYLRRGDVPNWALGIGVHYVSRMVERLEGLL